MTASRHSLALDKGELLLLPTETVWGVAARADNSAAIDKLYRAKGRNFNKPLTLCISSLEQAQSFGVFNRAATALAKRHWPGPLTLIVSAAPKAINHFDPRAFGHVGARKTIAFRCPDTLWRDSLCTSPLVLTSANKSGQADALTQDAARAALPGMQTYSGAQTLPPTLSGKPSTIISCIEGEVSVLRQGELKLNMDALHD